MYFFLILLLKFSASFGQDAPAKLGPYEVGKTTYVDFQTINGYTGNDRRIIETTEELTNALISDKEEIFLFTTIYELIPNYKKEIPTLQQMTLSNDSTTTFFITQINFTTYCVNNIFLSFFNDTLVSISYCGGPKLKDIILDKYYKKGLKQETEYSPSNCKHKGKDGKLIKDKRLMNSFYDKGLDVISIAMFYLNFDSDCQFYTYLRMRIFNSDKFLSIYQYALKWKKENEHFYTDEKNRIKELEKSNL